MQYSVIRKSDIDKARRFDAEYFKPEYLDFEKKLEGLKHDFLGNHVAKSGRGIQPKYAEGGGTFKVLTSKNIGYFFNEKYLPVEEDFFHDNRDFELEYGDLAVYSTGAYAGKISINLEKNILCSNHVNFLRLKSSINKFYVLVLLNLPVYFAMLNSKFPIGLGQKELYPFHLEGLRIPILPDSFQLEIEGLVKQAWQNRRQSKESHRQAERILLQELGLLDFEVMHRLSFSCKKSEVEKAERFDAEYFQPKYDEIIRHIEGYKGGFCAIGKMTAWQKGFEVGSDEYLDTGVDFGRVSDFSQHGFGRISKKISHEKYAELQEDFQPKKGEILFTKDGTIGISYLLDEDFTGILSSAFLRITSLSDFSKDCLTLILNSILTKLQVERMSGGAIISHLKPGDFEKIKIPLIRPAIQAEIAALIQQSHALRKEANALLEQAKHQVENEIERLAGR